MMIEFPVLLDKYRTLFAGTVRLVAFCVYNFSESYIFEEKYYIRFHGIVFAFIVSIFLLIFRPSIIRVFLGWDGLGVTSYFLVIYFDSPKSYGAGLLTALRNRVGDVIFIVRLVIFRIIRSWNFFNWSLSLEHTGLLLLIIIVGACTKRAQLPFSAWLPAAMAAPTPVSALVHSSTLVTAGVYVLFRFRPLFLKTCWREVLFYLGRFTILLAGVRALREIDAKKIVALSTLSQLGIIIITLGRNIHEIAFYHLLSHAFFKALLFMVVGNIIHLSERYQDLRKMSCERKISLESVIMGAISNFRLMGLPFLSGFYSKDLCIEISLAYINNLFGKFIFVLGVVLTVLYSLRFRYLRFRILNLSTRVWLEEKSHKALKGIYFLLGFAVAGRRMYLWLLFDRNIIFLQYEFKLIILFILGLSIVFYKFRMVPPTKFWVIEGLFYIWNLRFIRSNLKSKKSIRGAKINFLWSERNWLRSFSWQYYQNRNLTRNLRISFYYFKSILFLRIGLIIFLFI